MTEREQKLIDALRSIENELRWWQDDDRQSLRWRMWVARAAACDAIITATQT